MDQQEPASGSSKNDGNNPRHQIASVPENLLQDEASVLNPFQLKEKS